MAAGENSTSDVSSPSVRLMCCLIRAALNNVGILIDDGVDRGLIDEGADGALIGEGTALIPEGIVGSLITEGVIALSVDSALISVCNTHRQNPVSAAVHHPDGV